MNKNRGYFIVVEGMEGAGKTTALTTIKHYLADKVDRLVHTREPGGTHAGEIIRGIVKEIRPDEPLDPRAELLLMYASRIQLLQQVIYPALENGTWVLGDRFELSTFAYQGGGRQLDNNMIDQLSCFCLNGFQPDLTIFLDVDPQRGLQRAKNRSKADRIEQESERFFNRVYQEYQDRIKKMENVALIDADKPLKIVQQQIRATLEEFMSQHALPISN